MRTIAYGLAAILGVSLLSTPSQAQTTGGIAIEIPDINNFVGGAVGAGPDYFGSDDYTIVAAPTNGTLKLGRVSAIGVSQHPATQRRAPLGDCCMHCHTSAPEITPPSARAG